MGYKYPFIESKAQRENNEVSKTEESKVRKFKLCGQIGNGKVMN